MLVKRLVYLLTLTKGFTMGESIIYLLLFLVLSIPTALIAKKKNRRWGVWVLLSLFLSPLITFIAVLIVSKIDETQEPDENTYARSKAEMNNNAEDWK